MRCLHLKLWAGLLVVGGWAQAQFSDLAIRDDGSEVYFATRLRLASEASDKVPDGVAIYRIAGGSIGPVTIERVTTPNGIRAITYHSYSQGNPQVSADGRAFSYTEYYNCNGGSTCITYPSSSTSNVTVDGGPATQFKGEAQVSRNGRFVLNYLSSCCPISPPPSIPELHDLQTGTTLQLPALPPAGRRQALTSSGTALLLDRQSGSLMLWTAKSTRPVVTGKPPGSAIMNDAGTWIVYEGWTGSQTELRSFEVASGRDVVLASTASSYWYAPVFGSSISNDGALVLYVASSQLWTVRPDGTGGARLLTNFDAGVSEAVLSGNGQIAIAVTGGRVVSIDVATGEVTELIGRTPVCYAGVSAYPVPGSLFSLVGTALGESTAAASAPLPAELAGTQVFLNGTPLPLLSVSPSQVWFQVPFEASLSTAATLTVNYRSPFTGCSVEIPIAARSPKFFSDSSGNLLLFHQGFDGLVTDSSRARAGEMVTAYALGLGSVTPAMATGAATPADRLYPLDRPFGCYQAYYFQDGPPLEVGFAGLAPGLIGIYQVNVRMPDVLPESRWLTVNCGTPDNLYERAVGVVPIATQN